MKTILISMLVLLSTTTYSQWVVKNVNNGLDEPYTISYCPSIEKSQAIAKLERVGEQVAFYVIGSYFCEESPIVDIALIVNGESVKYQIIGTKSSDNTTVFLIDDLTIEDSKDFLDNFKKASKLIIRVNEDYCQDDIYTFNMSGSTKAYDTMSK